MINIEDGEVIANKQINDSSFFVKSILKMYLKDIHHNQVLCYFINVRVHSKDFTVNLMHFLVGDQYACNIY